LKTSVTNSKKINAIGEQGQPSISYAIVDEKWFLVGGAYIALLTLLFCRHIRSTLNAMYSSVISENTLNDCLKARYCRSLVIAKLIILPLESMLIFV
jgi:hypothetical protein